MADIGSSPVQTNPASACGPTLGRIVAFVESNNCASALRFEPTVYARLKKEQSILREIIRANNCSLETAEMIYATSWGKYQIMGFELYGDLKYSRTIADFLCNTSLQDVSFNLYVEMDKIDYSPRDLLDKEKRDTFAKWYNGPAKIEQYSTRLLDALAHFGVK